MKISLIIPACNEEGCIKQCIDTIINDSYLDKEIIVVNDGSLDRTEYIIHTYDNIKVIDYHKSHSAAFARNAGAKQATGELLIFIDADVIISEGFLSRVAKDYEQYKFRFAGINVKPMYDNIISQAFALEKANMPQMEHTGFINGLDVPCNAFIFNAAFFRQMGGFDESIFYFEDGLLTHKCLNHADMFINPAFLVFHKEPCTLAEVWRMGKYKGKGIISLYNSSLTGIKQILQCFIHPVCIALIIPYFLFASYRVIYERKPCSLKINVFDKFVIMPLKGLGSAYGIIKELIK